MASTRIALGVLVALVLLMACTSVNAANARALGRAILADEPFTESKEVKITHFKWIRYCKPIKIKIPHLDDDCDQNEH